MIKLIKLIKWIIQIWKSLQILALPLQADEQSFTFDHLKEINDALLTYPDGFNILKS